MVGKRGLAMKFNFFKKKAEKKEQAIKDLEYQILKLENDFLRQTSVPNLESKQFDKIYKQINYLKQL